MFVRIRPTRIPDDLPTLTDLRNAFESNPITAEEMGRRLERVTPGQIHHRLSADDEHGQMAGMAYAGRGASDEAGRWFVVVRTVAGLQGRGVGSALLEAAERWCREQGARFFEAEVRDDDDRSLAFARNRGYAVNRHQFESALAVRSFDEARFGGAVEAAEASGIRFVTLADLPDPEAWGRKVHAMMSQTVLDIPGVHVAQDWEAWSSWAMDAESIPRDCFLLALDGDRVAAVTMMEPAPQTGSMYTHHTSVGRAYRGRGLSLALKLVAVRAAKRRGATEMRTHNDSENAPILAINRKMGYVPMPGIYSLKKMLG